MEGHELAALVGRWARLRPTDGDGVVVQPAAARRGPWSSDDWVEVAVVSNLDTVLRCESRDRRAVALAGRPVMVELGASEAMVRMPATVRVLVDTPLPVVLAVAATGDLEHLQRRDWVRARVTVPVEIAVDARHGGGSCSGTTVDLSGGGARLRLSGELGAGERAALTLWLPTGPVEVHSRVLEVGDGTVRLAFDEVPESVCKRLVRFVFDVQVRNHRLAES